jgi:hypothetical protein
MARIEAASGLEAQHGERMIEVKVCFWTNDIAKGKGNVRPKHAWSGGVVRMERNSSHGIKPRNPVPFHSPFDVGAVIEKVLVQHGIQLHPSRRMRKYFARGRT